MQYESDIKQNKEENKFYVKRGRKRTPLMLLKTETDFVETKEEKMMQKKNSPLSEAFATSV